VGRLADAHRRCIYTVDWSRDGLLASGGADDAICIFGKPTAVAAAASAADAASSGASAAAAFSAAPTSGTVAAPVASVSSSSSSPPADLALLHTQLGAHSGDVNCVRWNPTTPDMLVSVGDDHVVKIWRYTSA
jgi:WD40 repeat protein